MEQKIIKDRNFVTKGDLDELEQAAIKGNYEAAYDSIFRATKRFPTMMNWC